MQRLCNEDLDESGDFRPNRHWGFRLHVTSGVMQNENEYEEFQCKRDMVLQWAETAIGCVERMDSRWSLESMAWPQGLLIDESSSELSTLYDCFASLRTDFQNNQSLTDSLQSVRTSGQSQVYHDSILSNVFLVTDVSSLESVMFSTGNVDNMYVWAVDPDFVQRPINADLSSSYQGFLKVRLQQIAHRIYEARK